MPSSIEDIVKMFMIELDNLKKKGVQITQEYAKAKDKVTHHILSSKISGKPIDPKILTSIPKPDQYIKEIGAIEYKIIALQKQYKINVEKLK